MLHPIYKLQIGSETIEPDSADDILDLDIAQGMDTPANNAKASIRIREQGITFSKGDPVTISLGYRENQPQLVVVFSGIVDRFNLGFYDADLFALSSFVKLCASHYDRFYEKKSAGDIVKDLAGAVNIQIKKASAGVKFPFYSIDSNKNCYEHMYDLAQLSGFDLFADSDDKLVFTNYQKKEPNHTLEYGKNIIGITKVDQTKLVQSVRIVGESPGESDQEHWITKKKKIEKTAGSGDAEILIQSRVAKTGDTAQQVAQSVKDRIIDQATSIAVEVVGDPSIFLSDTVEIKGTPNGALDGQYETRNVEHLMSKSFGFTTIITCRGEK